MENNVLGLYGQLVGMERGRWTDRIMTWCGTAGSEVGKESEREMWQRD
jgi:hypothetical protein